MNIVNKVEQIIYSEDYTLSEIWDILFDMYYNDDNLTPSELDYIESRMKDITNIIQYMKEGK